jgi:hypothetical protein
MIEWELGYFLESLQRLELVGPALVELLYLVLELGGRLRREAVLLEPLHVVLLEESQVDLSQEVLELGRLAAVVTLVPEGALVLEDVASSLRLTLLRVAADRTPEVVLSLAYLLESV